MAALLGLGILLAFCVWNGAGTALHEFPLDDGWIHQVYVRGLLRDGAPTYNPGVLETGFSSPLWLLGSLPFHAAARAADLLPVVPVKLASLLCAVVAALGMGRLASALAGNRARASIIAVAWTLMAPGFAFAAVSGMEVSLATATLVWMLVWLHEGRLWRAGIVLALAVLARPEAGAAALVVAGVGWFYRGQLNASGSQSQTEATQDPVQVRLPPWLRDALVLLGPTVLVACAWATYNLGVSGHPLPNTYYVKTGVALGVVARLQYLAVRILFDAGLPVGLSALALIGGGITVAWRYAPRPLFVATLAIVLLVTGAVVVTHPLSTPVLFYSQRYFYPFTTLALAFAAVGADRLLMVVEKRGPAEGLVAVAFLALGSAFLIAPGLAEARTRYADHCRDIDRLHRQPALFAREALAPGEVLAAEGAGASAFFSERQVVDLVGLNDHRLAHALHDPELKNCRIADAGPTLMLVPDLWLNDLSPGFDMQILRRFESPRWSVVGGRMGRVVVAARARLRPDVVAYCMQILKERR